MRIVFMGSPEFALPSLRELVTRYPGDVVAVYTQPDRESGRGRKPQPPPVKTLALEYGIPVCQPMNFRSSETVAELAAWQPEVIAVAAFGQILPKSVLETPTRGLLNVHASLLPRWRGAAPIAYSILSGDDQTGVTIMEIVRALDAGPMVSRAATPILDDDTTGTLSARLAEVGATLLADTLPGWYARVIPVEAQDDALTTYAPPLTKEEGLIDWSEPAKQIWRRVRAYNPWPGARAILPNGEQLTILEAKPVPLDATEEPGTVLPSPAGNRPSSFSVACGEGALLPVTVQRAGRKPMSAGDFLRGYQGLLNSRLNVAPKT